MGLSSSKSNTTSTSKSTSREVVGKDECLGVVPEASVLSQKQHLVLQLAEVARVNVNAGYLSQSESVLSGSSLNCRNHVARLKAFRTMDLPRLRSLDALLLSMMMIRVPPSFTSSSHQATDDTTTLLSSEIRDVALLLQMVRLLNCPGDNLMNPSLTPSIADCRLVCTGTSGHMFCHYGLGKEATAKLPKDNYNLHGGLSINGLQVTAAAYCDSLAHQGVPAQGNAAPSHMRWKFPGSGWGGNHMMQPSFIPHLTAAGRSVELERLLIRNVELTGEIRSGCPFPPLLVAAMCNQLDIFARLVRTLEEPPISVVPIPSSLSSSAPTKPPISCRLGELQYYSPETGLGALVSCFQSMLTTSLKRQRPLLSSLAARSIVMDRAMDGVMRVLQKSTVFCAQFSSLPSTLFPQLILGAVLRDSIPTVSFLAKCIDDLGLQGLGVLADLFALREELDDESGKTNDKSSDGTSSSSPPTPSGVSRIFFKKLSQGFKYSTGAGASSNSAIVHHDFAPAGWHNPSTFAHTLINADPIYILFKVRSLGMMRYLIELGADVTVKRKSHIPRYNNRTVLQAALQEGDKSMALLLIKHGATIEKKSDLRRFYHSHHGAAPATTVSSSEAPDDDNVNTSTEDNSSSIKSALLAYSGNRRQMEEILSETKP